MTQSVTTSKPSRILWNVPGSKPKSALNFFQCCLLYKFVLFIGTLHKPLSHRDGLNFKRQATFLNTSCCGMFVLRTSLVVAVQKVVEDASLADGICHADLPHTGAHRHVTAHPELVRSTHEVRQHVLLNCNHK